MERVLCIVGPTASGKSAVAMRLAKAMQGEIVCMDSMQIYRGMDIGTAKPTMKERGEVAHHMVDVVEPTEPFTVSQYVEMAEPILRDIARRGHRPILVGGTGFYLRAIADGLALGGAKGDPLLRAKYDAIANETDGRRKLHAMLEAVDPVSAERLHENDVRRVARALEVYELTGRPFSMQEQPEKQSNFELRMLGITLPREMLYERINRRVDEMIASGLADEVRSLLAQGVPADEQSMKGIGYKELIPVVQDGAPLDAAVELLKQNTRHYAKRQWTWFRAEQRVQWFDASTEENAIQQEAEEFFTKG